MTTEHYKKKFIEIITKHLPNTSIYLYGSRARKDHHEGANVDLALDNKKNPFFYLSAQFKKTWKNQLSHSL